MDIFKHLVERGLALPTVVWNIATLYDDIDGFSQELWLEFDADGGGNAMDVLTVERPGRITVSSLKPLATV